MDISDYKRNSRIELVQSIIRFIEIKKIDFEIISKMIGGQYNYNIVFIEKEILEEYMNLLQVFLNFQVTEKFDAYLFCLVLSIIGLYFDNQYDDLYFKLMVRKLNKEKKISNYERDYKEYSFRDDINFIITCDMQIPELIAYLKLIQP